jgi:hypothetical protein
MTRIRTAGLCLVAAFASTAIAASAAYAEPSGEFGACAAKAGGRYENSGCTKEKGGANKFEWTPLTTAVKFTSKSKAGTITTLETATGTKVTCRQEQSVGEIATATELANVVMTFEGCETSAGQCQSKGAMVDGQIVTNPLGGGTGVEKKGTTPPINNKLAEELHGPGGVLVEFECLGLPIVVTGSVLHPTISGKMLTTTAENLRAVKAEQKPSHYEGEAEDSHALAFSANGGAGEEAGLTIAGVVTFANAVELNPTR